MEQMLRFMHWKVNTMKAKVTIYDASTKEYRTEWVEQEEPPIVEEPPIEQPPTQDERIAELEKQNELLTQCLLEMSMLVYQ